MKNKEGRPFKEELALSEIVDPAKAQVIKTLTKLVVFDPAKITRLYAAEALKKRFQGCEPDIFCYDGRIYFGSGPSDKVINTDGVEVVYNKGVYVCEVPKEYDGKPIEIHLKELKAVQDLKRDIKNSNNEFLIP